MTGFFLWAVVSGKIFFVSRWSFLCSWTIRVLSKKDRGKFTFHLLNWFLFLWNQSEKAVVRIDEYSDPRSHTRVTINVHSSVSLIQLRITTEFIDREGAGGRGNFTLSLLISWYHFQALPSLPTSISGNLPQACCFKRIARKGLGIKWS